MTYTEAYTDNFWTKRRSVMTDITQKFLHGRMAYLDLQFCPNILKIRSLHGQGLIIWVNKWWPQFWRNFYMDVVYFSSLFARGINNQCLELEQRFSRTFCLYHTSCIIRIFIRHALHKTILKCIWKSWQTQNF